MLNRMKLSYFQFMMLISLGFAGKVIGLPFWGWVAHRANPRLLLWIGAVSIVPLSALWLVTPWLDRPVWFLVWVQLIGGIAWAAYELAFFLLFFETIPRAERTSVLTLYNFGNALALVLGAVLGALWLSLENQTDAAFLHLFGISSIVRACSLVLLLRVPLGKFEPADLALRTIALRPSEGGSLDRPILPSIPETERESLSRT
jgi:MFS family permease